MKNKIEIVVWLLIVSLAFIIEQDLISQESVYMAIALAGAIRGFIYKHNENVELKREMEQLKKWHEKK